MKFSIIFLTSGKRYLIAVREMLAKRGITPENLPPAEDIKKLQRKLDADEKKVLKNVQTQKGKRSNNR